MQVCSDGEIIRVKDDAYSPQGINEEWREHVPGTASDWEINGEITVECKGTRNQILHFIKIKMCSFINYAEDYNIDFPTSFVGQLISSMYEVFIAQFDEYFCLRCSKISIAV